MKIIEPVEHEILTETYFVIMDGKGYNEVRPSCLANFEGYTVIGIVEHTEKFSTYSIIATENLPEFYLTKVNTFEDFGDRIHNVPDDTLDKAIKIRAKDIKYKG